MSYLDILTPEAKKNAQIIIDRMNKNDITNPYSQAALLSIVSKESGFIPRKETSYANTSNDRIRTVFGSRVSGLSDDELTALKKDYNKFFERVYGNQFKTGRDLGNTNPGDGAKYVGRGFHQITGKYNYQKYGKAIGKDLVSNPELVNDPSVAADILIAYYKGEMSKSGNKLSQYNATNINDFKSVFDSTNAFYHATAGWGKTTSQIQSDPTGGYKKSLERSPSFLTYVQEYVEKKKL